jgi:hypothetical protein
MSRTIIPPLLLLPLDSVKLGRFVTNIEHPHENYYSPSFTETPKSIEADFLFTGQNQNGTDAAFWFTLTSLVSARFSRSAKSNIHIAPAYGKKYSLDNSNEWFEKAVGDTETRRWIEKAALRGDTIYMIVGIVTLSDVRVVEDSAAGRHIGAEVHVPVELSLAAAGAAVPFAGLIDPTVHGSYRSIEKDKAQFLSPGEKVCALQYRKIPHKWFSSRRLDMSSLKSTRLWLCLEGDRRNMYDDEDDEDEDGIEVGLEDMDNLDGEWDIQQVSTGDVICIPS